MPRRDPSAVGRLGNCSPCSRLEFHGLAVVTHTGLGVVCVALVGYAARPTCHILFSKERTFSLLLAFQMAASDCDTRRAQHVDSAVCPFCGRYDSWIIWMSRRARVSEHAQPRLHHQGQFWCFNQKDH